MGLGIGRRVVKATAALADAIRPPPVGLVVLIYHRVGRRAPIETDLPTGLFEDQIALLAEEAEIVSLSDGLHELDSNDGTGSPRTRRLVTLTFDDGTADFAELALPVLERHHMPVTLYLATAFVEEQRPFPNDGVPLSWDALRDACLTGLVSVGSHTHCHALLDRIPPQEVADELDRSIDLIGERLGLAATDFAYPKAIRGTPEADRAVRSRFRSAAVAGTRSNPFGATDPYQLARSPVQASDGMRWFERKARGGLRLEDWIRRRADRRRYANANS